MIALEALGPTQSLNLEVFIDDEVTAQVGVWAITGPVVAGTGVVSYRAVYLERRACTSVKVVASWSTAETALGGFKMISITLEVEPTGGMRLLSDAEKN